MNPMFTPYGGYNPYNPIMAQQQRLAELEQQYPQFAGQNPNQNMMNNMGMNNLMQSPNQNFVKCRAVTSIDEAKASMIDLDGSVHVFTDLGNKRIYTKQINLDGTATLNTYTFQENPAEKPQEPEKPQTDLPYVKQEELEAVCRTFNQQIGQLEEKLMGYESLFSIQNELSSKPAARETKSGGNRK